MKYYNLFTQLYKGGRALLYNIAITLQQTDFSLADEGAISLEKMQQALHLLNAYAWMEEKYVVPALHKYSPQAVVPFTGSQAINAGLQQQLKGLLQLYNQAAHGRARQDAGDNITKTFISFLAIKLEHMARKEAILLPVLQKYYSEQQIMEVQRKILSALPLQQMVLYYRWMLRGTNNAEITEWLKSMEQTCSAESLEFLLQIVEEELSPERWKIIMDRLSEAQVV